MEYIPLLFARFRQIIAAAWPDVLAIDDAMHLNQIPWQRIELPTAVIHIERLTPGADGRAAVLTHRANVDIYYVAMIDGPLSPIISKLETMRDALAVAPLLTAPDGSEWGNLYDVQDMSWDDSLKPNVYLSTRNDPARAGMIRACIEISVRYTPGTGPQPA